MKRICLIFLIVVLILAVSACDKASGQVSSAGKTVNTELPEITVDDTQGTTVGSGNNSDLTVNEIVSVSGINTQAISEHLLSDSASNIVSTSADEQRMDENIPCTAWIVGSNVNLRGKPSRDAEIIAVLPYGQEVVLHNDTGEWKRVSVNNKEGYVFAEYVVAEKTEQAESSVQARISVYNQFAENSIIAIDAGHQAKGNNEYEPIGPGASESKPKVASGTQGIVTKVPEYELTLEVSLKLRDELLARGYDVFMIRETNDVNISNKERAVMAADAGADILIRIHADGSENSNVNGVLTLCPTKNNPFIPNLYNQSRKLSDDVLSAMASTTGAKNRGVSEVDNMSGINWSTIPVTIVEMGLMTNETEDKLMQTDEYQQKLVTGIANGIAQYFTEHSNSANVLDKF